MLIMLILVAFGLFAPRPFGRPIRIAGLTLLLIFCGLRIEVGPDWYSYIFLYDYLISDNSQYTLLSEPSFTALCTISNYFGYGIIGVNFICAMIYLIGLFLLASKTPFPWCVLAVAFCYYVPALPMNIIRQAAAVGIILALVANWDNFNTFIRSLFVVFAMTFHASAIIMFALVFAALRIPMWQRAALAIIGLVSAVEYGIDPLQFFSLYRDRYVEGVGGVVTESTGAIFQWMIIAVPSAWYLFYRKRLQAIGHESELMFVSSQIALAMIFILPFSSVAVTRLSMYFSYIPLFVSGTMVAVYKSPKVRLTTRGGLMIVATSVLILWLFVGENSKLYTPYHNIVFEQGGQSAIYLSR